jgi:2-polyprenyl-6-methoxyphenol hydroxylase-like FAD-dependent oxidoreductase
MVRNDSALGQNETRRALVIGAGMAGLLAARVLADYYEDVLVVERDVFSDNLDARPGTPQAFHVHRILPRGKMILERFFPGYIDELIAAGAYSIQDKKVRMVNPNGLFMAYQPELDVSCSRTLLEREVRQRVQALSGVHFLSNKEVIGLEAAPDGERISGIYLRERGQLDERTVVTADLIVDASGRTSKLSQWLPELGYALPADAQVKTNIGYSTRHYKASPQTIDAVGSIVVDELHNERKSGVGILPVENDTLWVTLFATGGKYPATDVEGFEEEITHLNRLGAELSAALKESDPLTPPHGYRVPACVRHHYEQAQRWPAGLLVVGDALCHFDPIYGQGMTVAAIEAETLAGSLDAQQRDPQPNFEQNTLQRMQNAISPAWWLSAVSDLRSPHVTYEGEDEPQNVALIHRYLDLYYIYAQEHPVEAALSLSAEQPTPVKFLLLNGLAFPPAAIFNVPTFTLLLDAEAASSEPQILQQLVDKYQLSLAEILEQVVPAFSLTFDALPAGNAS